MRVDSKKLGYLEERLFVALNTYVDGSCGGSIKVQCQVLIGPYRADFVVIGHDTYGNSVNIAIECDGHEFHEKTKEQAERDKTRDRIFQANGLKILRFTGSDVNRNADRCAMEVRALIAIQEDNFRKCNASRTVLLVSSNAARRFEREKSRRSERALRKRAAVGGWSPT